MMLQTLTLRDKCIWFNSDILCCKLVEGMRMGRGSVWPQVLLREGPWLQQVSGDCGEIRIVYCYGFEYSCYWEEITRKWRKS